jgi:hypothetical protein
LSGRKNILPPFKLIDATSLATAFSSSPVTVTTTTHVAISIETSGVTGNTGTFGVSHQIYKDDREYGPWVPLTLTSVPTLANADIVDMLDLRVPPGRLKVTFVPAGGTAEVQTLTWPALAAATNGDHIVVYDSAGTTWAVGIDKTGGAVVTPSSAAWTAATHKVLYDFSSGTTAASMAALAELAFNSLTGFTAAITTDDTAANGTMTLTQVTPGATTDPVPKNAAGGGAGSIAGVQSTPGVRNGTVTSWVTGNMEG